MYRKVIQLFPPGEMMYKLGVTVRPMVESDIPHVAMLRAEFGNFDDILSYGIWLKVDPNGMYVAVTKTGEIIGSCSSIVHHEDFAFFGLYIVKSMYRRQGIGPQIFNSCMAHTKHRNAGLNCYEEFIDKYKSRSGFLIWKNLESSIVNMYETYETIYPENLCDLLPYGTQVKTFSDSYLPSILEYDYELIGYDRKLALELSFQSPFSKAFVALSNDKCVGFGIIRLRIDGSAFLGPLYADEPAVAEVLLKNLIGSMSNARGLVFNCPSNNEYAGQMMQKIGCKFKKKCFKMYIREVINVALEKVYGLFDLFFSPF